MKQSEKTMLEFAGFCFIHKPELAKEINSLIADFIHKPEEQLIINDVSQCLPEDSREFKEWQYNMGISRQENTNIYIWNDFKYERAFF